jgi:hypothetical protein
MTVREIKEMVMRTASRLEQAEELLRASFREGPPFDGNPYFITGMIPVFFEDFLVNVRDETVRQAVGRFARVPSGDYENPVFTFHGIERRSSSFKHTVSFWRNGLLNASSRLLRK